MAQVQKIRVCIAAPSLDINGGQARQAVRLLTGFASEDSLAVDFIPHNPRLPAFLRVLSRVKYLRTILTTIHYVVLLAARVRRYDIVHVFSASYWSYLLSTLPPLIVAKIYGKKVLLNYHSGEAEDHLARWPRTTVPLMNKYDAIVVPSAYLVDVFAKGGLKAIAIPNTVELDKFRFRDRAPLQPKFLCSRLLEPLYNVGNVIRAFHLIQQRFQNASLTIAGDGRQRAELEQLVADLGLRNTLFLGFVPFEAMPSLYDAHDIYLMANDIDNMPASVIESCACGVLIVTTNAGGIPYLVQHEHSALMVECGDYQGLAREAMRLLDDPGLARRLAQNALQRAGEFSWERVRDKWLLLYKGLMNRSGSRR